MSGKKRMTVLHGSPPTEEEKFYVSWGNETLKNNLTLANEVLRQLVTLNGVLLGGSIAFFDARVIAPGWKVWIILAFFLSLIISFLGMMPYESAVDLRIPEEIKLHKENALRSKRRYLWGAGITLAIGFGIALAGIIVRSLIN